MYDDVESGEWLLIIEAAACTSEDSLLVAAQEVPDSHRAVVWAGGKFTICWRETGQHTYNQ